jgi:hypothetical protein
MLEKKSGKQNEETVCITNMYTDHQPRAVSDRYAPIFVQQMVPCKLQKKNIPNFLPRFSTG